MCFDGNEYSGMFMLSPYSGNRPQELRNTRYSVTDRIAFDFGNFSIKYQLDFPRDFPMREIVALNAQVLAGNSWKYGGTGYYANSIIEPDFRPTSETECPQVDRYKGG